MRPISILKTLSVAADDDGISLSQTPAGAGDLTITGALASGGVATLASARQVLITAAGNESGRIFTVYGTDEVGQVISEAVTGPNATTGVTAYHYKTVTRVAIDGAAAGAVKVGTNGVGASKGVLLEHYANPFNVSLFVNVTGTVNYTVQQTYDKHRASGFHWGAATWVPHADLTAKTADTAAVITSPVTGVRLLINSGTGAAEMIVRQAG